MAMPPSEHFPAIVAYLRSELEKERASHARTHDQAELEILTLRGQLARREAELEACVIHTFEEHKAYIPEAHKSTGVPGTSSQHPGPTEPTASGVHPQPQHATVVNERQRIPASSITPEGATRLLGLTVTRNRKLEAEVKELSTRVSMSHECLTIGTYSPSFV